MTYDTLIENGQTYYRTQCDYPGCEAKYEGDEYEYWETPDLAAEDATSLDMWLAMTDWNGNVLFFCPKHLRQKELLGADLYVEDEPDTIDRLLDFNLPVLIGRHGYNLRQCERAERHRGIAAVFDDWHDVPELATRLLEQ